MRQGLAAALGLGIVAVAFFAGRGTAQPGRDAVLPRPPSLVGHAGPAAPPRLAEARDDRAPAAGTAAAAPPVPPPDVATPADMRGSVAPLVDRVKGAVVTIRSTTIVKRPRIDQWSLFFGGEPRATEERVQSLGSGFVIDRQGTILTNNHVVAGATEVLVVLGDKRELPARVLGSDPETDVAVVKLQTPAADVQPAALGDSEALRVGDYVLAIGNPLGLGQTVTMGIVSAKNRSLPDKLGDMDRRFQDFIQTDAAINQGNSGGPLFNFAGEVVGINSAILNPAMAMNVGFAIPINLARRIADQIRKTGGVERGYMGVSGIDLTPEDARKLGLPFRPGALLSTVAPKSPAEAAGLRPNDVVIELAGATVDGYRRLPSLIGSRSPGESVRVAYLRGGRRFETNVVLGSAAASVGEAIFLGLRVRPLDAREAAGNGLRPGQGAMVVWVDPRGPASGTILEGDVILGVNGQPTTVADLKAVGALLKRGAEAQVAFRRGRRTFAITIAD